MPLFRADSLCVDLGAAPVLRELTFEVEAGEWVGVIGPNGSGKTTLLRTLAGLLPYRGVLTLDGRPLRTWRPRALARRLAFVRQSPPLEFDFTVGEFVLLGRAPHRGWLDPYTKDDRERAQAALATMNLAGYEGRSLGALSGGEQQRVLLAQALAQQAEILLLDEPTAHLDVHHQFEGMDRVAALVRAGRTVLAAFHDLALAARHAHRLLVLDRGRLAAAGPPREVLTAELVRAVFRMEAEVVRSAEGALDVRYLAPVPSA